MLPNIRNRRDGTRSLVLLLGSSFVMLSDCILLANKRVLYHIILRVVYFPNPKECPSRYYLCVLLVVIAYGYQRMMVFFISLAVHKDHGLPENESFILHIVTLYMYLLLGDFLLTCYYFSCTSGRSMTLCTSSWNSRHKHVRPRRMFLDFFGRFAGDSAPPATESFHLPWILCVLPDGLFQFCCAIFTEKAAQMI